MQLWAVAIETWKLWTRSQLPTASQRMGADVVALLQGLILLCGEKALGTNWARATEMLN